MNEAANFFTGVRKAIVKLNCLVSFENVIRNVVSIEIVYAFPALFVGRAAYLASAHNYTGMV